MAEYDYIILGGGISGLSFGRLLQKYTDKSFIILEKENEVGGLCRTKNINGNLLDIGGGHFLYSKHKKVYDFIFSHISESSFLKHDRLTKIKIHNTFIDFPIEDNIWQLPKDIQYKYILSIINLNKNNKINNFEEWIVNKLGNEIAENYLIPYNKKIWGTEVSELGTEWLYKIPDIDVKKIIKSVIYNTSDSNNIPSHKYFYYPEKGGFQVIIDSVYKTIKNNVILNEEIKLLNYDENNKNWIINGKYLGGKIINTIPWNILNGYLKDKNIDKLKHNSIVVSLHKENYENNWQWCYEPNLSIDYHRKFYLNNYCNNNGDFCVSHEINNNRWNEKKQNKLLYHHINEYAYPIPTSGYINNIGKILEKYSTKNLYGLGRWGQWQYHNSDICILEAMNLFNNLENKHI